MPQNRYVPVNNLALDLKNFRTVPQTNEVQAIQAMVSISPDRFWALMESLLDDGYLATENILVMDLGQNVSNYVVKEGNRRIAALKLIYGFVSRSEFNIPAHILQRIEKLSEKWKRENSEVPCTVYALSEASTVDRVVTLAHGKGEKASRDQWNAVARARHNRDARNESEPALDLLEKYLDQGKNLTTYDSETWAGTYPLTVLEDALKRIAPRFGVSNSPDLAKKYPMVQYRDALDAILYDIGIKSIRFETMRKRGFDFAVKYGIPPLPSDDTGIGRSVGGAAGGNVGGTVGGTVGGSEGGTAGGTVGGSEGGAAGGVTGGSAGSATGESAGGAGDNTGNNTNNGNGDNNGGANAGKGRKKRVASPIEAPATVMRLLRQFKPRGKNRQKIESLRREALELNIEKTPLAFCFLLRSMFEISAKVYCDDHLSSGLTAVFPSGKDRPLLEVLNDIVGHLINQGGSVSLEKVKALHGAKTELAKSESLLSVTSLNQLVHNPRFGIRASDISILFGNIYPLLEAMNS